MALRIEAIPLDDETSFGTKQARYKQRNSKLSISGELLPSADLNLSVIGDSYPQTSRNFTNRLMSIQVLSLFIMITSGALQAIAIATSDWYILNVNEYIPMAKGGLWLYCYVTSTDVLGRYRCSTYENLPLVIFILLTYSSSNFRQI